MLLPPPNTEERRQKPFFAIGSIIAASLYLEKIRVLSTFKQNMSLPDV